MIPRVIEQDGPGDPTREVWILHGILGSARNWRSFGRALAADAPGWRVVLVDQRSHGDSGPGVPPHTVEACARDLVDLSMARGRGPEVLVGHSFGGKVALRAAGLLGAPLRSVWVLDAVPGPVQSSASEVSGLDAEVAAVIRAVERIPMPVESREEVRDALLADGFSPALAGWMTTNLHRAGGDGLVWRFHLSGVRELIADYAAVDLWPVAEDPPVDLHLVRAARSDRWTADVLARLERVAQHPRGHVHVLRDAGHWVHVDAPDALRAWLSADLLG